MMHGLTVNNIHLDEVLHPVAYYLDNCWWYLGGNGMNFPSIQGPRLADVPPGSKVPEGLARWDAADLKRYDQEFQTAPEEYGKWLIDDDQVGRICKPGFFSRSARGMDSNWKMHCASDAATPNIASFDAFARLIDGNWGGEPPTDTPDDLCLITRDIDSAYLDLFFRDDWMFKAVWSFCLAKGMNPRPFERPDLGDARS